VAVVRARKLLLVCAALLVGGLGALATQLSFNFSPDKIFVSGDDTLAFYVDRQIPAFGSGDKTTLLAIEGDLRKEATQRTLAQLHKKLADTPGVQDVQSLVTAQVPQAGALGFSPIFDGETANAAHLETAAKDPSYAGLLVSQDMKVAVIIFQLRGAGDSDELRKELVARVVALVDEAKDALPEGMNLHLAGTPVSQENIVALLKKDQLTFVPIVVLVMGILLYLAFRDLRGVILPFLATGCATVWALGYLVVIGHEINVVNNAMVVLLLVIGIADAVHLVARFQDELDEARALLPDDEEADKDEVLARTIQAMTLPCLLTTTTTSIGFGSALVAKMELIQQFGTDAAVGVLFAFFSTMAVVPALLGVLPLPARHRAEHTGLFSRLHVVKWLDRIARTSLRHWKLVLACSVALFGVAGFLATQVSANQKLMSELPDSDPTVQATRFIEERMVGVLPFDVVFEAEDAGRLLEPDAVREMAKVAAWIDDHEIGATARGYPDILASLDRALVGEEKTTPVHEWNDAKLAQLQLLFDMSEPEVKDAATDGFISPDGKLVRLVGLTPDPGTYTFAPFREDLQAVVDAVALEGVKAHLSGGTVIATRALENIVTDMAASLGLAMFMILCFITLLFRSLRVGLLALFPNVLPIVTALAAMAVFGVELRVATVIIFSMALGVAVDASVHLLARLREELQTHGDDDAALRDALLRTLKGAGRPVVYSTLLLLLGFVVMGLSEFNALRDFALLSGMTLGAALVIDIVLLPALVLFVNPKLSTKR
jgi:predicted RND superfamily exporter protein